MERIAFIQSDEAGLPYSVAGAAAARGFAVLGYPVQLFQPEEMLTLPLERAVVVAGGMGTIHAALEQLGVPRPSVVSLPPVLEPFIGRTHWKTVPTEVRAMTRFPLFVKPYEDSKRFNGRIVESAADFDRLIAPRPGFPVLPDNVPLLVQEPVTFLSEWRAFVVRGVIVGISHYAGDPLLFPAPGIIRAAVGSYTMAPAGYCADFGVTNDKRTLLVEVNDGYALGHGGLVADRYAELLRARWQEIIHR